MRSIRTRFAIVIYLHSSMEELYNTNVAMWVRFPPSPQENRVSKSGQRKAGFQKLNNSFKCGCDEIGST